MLFFENKEIFTKFAHSVIKSGATAPEFVRIDGTFFLLDSSGATNNIEKNVVYYSPDFDSRLIIDSKGGVKEEYLDCDSAEAAKDRFNSLLRITSEIVDESENLTCGNNKMAAFLQNAGLNLESISNIINSTNSSAKQTQLLVSKDALENVVDLFYNIEQRHWNESEQPRNHIFNQFKKLKESLDSVLDCNFREKTIKTYNKNELYTLIKKINGLVKVEYRADINNIEELLATASTKGELGESVVLPYIYISPTESLSGYGVVFDLDWANDEDCKSGMSNPEDDNLVAPSM